MSSSSIDIGDYKPCTMTPDDFRAALALTVPAHLHKQVCDLHAADDAARKQLFEAQLVGISNNFKAHRAENTALKKKLEDNAMLQKYFREAMPYITAQAAAFQAYHTPTTTAGSASADINNSNNGANMSAAEIIDAVKTSSGAQKEKAISSGFQQLESQSQFLFGASFKAVSAENQKIIAENVVMKNLLQEYEKQK